MVTEGASSHNRFREQVKLQTLARLVIKNKAHALRYWMSPDNRSMKFRMPMCNWLLLPLLLAGAWSLPAAASKYDGNKWPGAQADFYVGIPGTSSSGIAYSAAFIDAANQWSEQTRFNFNIVEELLDPCINDARNGVDFTDDVCDEEFGSNVLAVTIRRYAGEVLGPARISQADIVVNQDILFDVYDGPPKFVFGQPTRLDFRRIILHELGHVIGLDHDNGPPAIMASTIGNIFQLQQDDIDGVNALYSSLDNCQIKTLKFGINQDSLDGSDCSVAEMTAGGEDTSFVDLFRFDLHSITTVNFVMSGANLDSVLVLADTDLRFLGFDDKSSNLCDSTLSQTLQPGSYFILANTFDIPPKEECSNLGPYTITASFNTASKLQLGANFSLKGGMSSASFSGGVTANNGLSYGNRFKPNDSLDISAAITVDPAHQGQAGFLVVAAALGEQVLFLNESGLFVESPDLTQLPRAATRTLQANEQIQIANNLVAASLGIQSISVDFYVGYGLLSDPGELYYHGSPLNLTIAP